jgi:hypothetical protein
MKRGLLFGSMVIATITMGFILGKGETETVRDYQPRTTSKKQAYSQHAERYKHYVTLLGNSKTGKIEPQDRLDSWAAMQKFRFNETKSLSLSFVDRGPDNIGGRTRAIGIDRADDNIMYAGSVSGGLFKSTDMAQTWNRVQTWDAQVGIMCISSIETTTAGVVYVATGGDQFEGGVTTGGSGTQSGANGVYYSTDGGGNWTHLSGTAGSVMQLWRDPSQNDKIYIGGTTCLVSPDFATGASSIGGVVTGNGYDIKASGDGSVVFVCSRVGGSFRYYVSTDFGASFTQITLGLPTAIGRAECSVTDVTNSDGKYNIYVSASTGGGTLHSVSLSEDHGATWTNIGPGGSSLFSPFSTTLSAQGNYDQTISYVKGLPDQCMLGGIDQYLWVKDSTSSPTWGGWTQFSLWSAHPSSPLYIHADNHEMKFNDQGVYFYGNDGGVGAMTFGVASPTNKGYNVTQFYSIAHDKHGAVMAGAQDNGTLYNDYTLASTMQFREVRGGDGFDCDISHYDSDAMFATVYNSAVSRSEDNGNNWQELEVDCAGEIGESCGVFHTPLRLFEDPNDLDSRDSIYYYPTDSTIPAGTNITYYSSTYSSTVPENVLSYTNSDPLYFTDSLISMGNIGGDFYALHPGTSDTVWMGMDSMKLNYPYDTLSLQDPVQSMLATLANSSTAYQVMLTRDGLRFGKSPEWWDVTDGSGFNNPVMCFEFSWDGNILYVGTYNDGLWRIKGLDSVYSAADVSTLQVSKIYSTGRPVNGIAIDKNDPERLIIARSQTGGGSLVELDNCASGSTASLVSTTVQGNIPTTMAVLDVIIDYRDPQKLVCGSDFGAWASSDGGSTWTQCIDETGPVPVFAVRQQQREWNESSKAGEIYLGTHGRGVWTSGSVLSNGDDVEHVDVSDSEFQSGLSVYPNPLDEMGRVTFELNQREDVSLYIYNINGKLIKTISQQNMVMGKHTLDLDMSGIGKGTYIIELKAGSINEVTRFIKLK